MRATKFRMWTPFGDGTWQAKELPGPQNLAQWKASFRVYKTALIMLDLVSLANLQLYEGSIGAGLHKGWGIWCRNPWRKTLGTIL